MGEKSTITRDRYASELQAFVNETPVSKWPVYRQKVSLSGMERAMQARGLESFERKRLESAACRPIIKKMNEDLILWLSEKSETKKVKVKVKVKVVSTVASNDSNVSSKELAKAQRRITQLEKLLRKAEQQSERYKEKYALLQAESEGMQRQQDAFENHCRESMRTLHVD